MEFSPRLKVAGSLLAGVLLFWAIPGAVANLKAWRDASETIPVQVPWPYLALSAMGILAVVWAPTLWKWLTGHRKKLSRAAEADQLEARAVAAEQKASTLQSEVDAVRDLLTDARKELAETAAGKERVQKIASSFSSKLDFGKDLPEYHPATADNVEVMLLRLWEIQPPLSGLRASTDQLWNKIVRQARENGEGTSVSWVADRIGVWEYANLYRIQEHIRSALDNKWDPRRYVARFYTCYCDWRAVVFTLDAMFALDPMIGKSVKLTEEYQKWREAERKYFDQLQAKLAIPQFREVRRTIREYDQAQGNAGLMPGLPE